MWLYYDTSGMKEVLTEHQFVSRILSQLVAGEDTLLTEDYSYDIQELETTMGKLYDW